MTQTNHILVRLTWPQRDHLQRALPQTLSFLFCCGAITFLFLLSPAPKTLAQLLRHVCTWGKQSHSSLSGDVLYAAGQLSPPAAPAARAANLEKMHNMHIANSHSSSQNCAPDTQAQPSKLLRLCTSERHVLSRSWLPRDRHDSKDQKNKPRQVAVDCDFCCKNDILPLPFPERPSVAKVAHNH